jgi:hypothetical protein
MNVEGRVLAAATTTTAFEITLMRCNTFGDGHATPGKYTVMKIHVS